MSEDKNKKTAPEKEEQYSLNDDRRVKVLSPGTLVAKRFFRNRLAVLGLTMLAIMFIFSFVGGWISPYGEGQFFYRTEMQMKEFAGVKENAEYRFLVPDSDAFDTIAKAELTLHLGKDDSYTYKDNTYDIKLDGDGLYSVTNQGKLVCVAYLDVISFEDPAAKASFEFSYAALEAHVKDQPSFTAEGKTYGLDGGIISLDGEDIGSVSRVIIQSKVSGRVIPREFKEKVNDLLVASEDTEDKEFSLVIDGEDREYNMVYDPANLMWSVKESTPTTVYDKYSFPSREHWLGTDGAGMDMLTRLMYGGRVSLIIGFVVIIIETVIGVILGGIAGYFGGWVDNLIMRIVDIFYCIPSMPLIIILGSAMDAMRVDPQVRMLYLMLLLGVFGWAGVARMVRGQILSLREQEFMTATEACGISTTRRIFRHLIPNVIPQLIVNCTMGLGSVILTEATLSFLGLGVKFPFASWGNIINDVNNPYTLTTYLHVWIPAGICLMVTVLGFNFVGDGLRDAFDPKMKR